MNGRNTFFEGIKAGLEDAVAFGQGDKTRASTTIIEPIDIKALRNKLSLTQEQFAEMTGASLPTIQAWEHKSNPRYPTGPTQKLFQLLLQKPSLANDLQKIRARSGTT